MTGTEIPAGNIRGRKVSLYAVSAASTLACGAWQGHWLAQLLAVVGFVLLPGMVVLSMFNPRGMPRLAQLTTATGLGMVMMMAVGALSSVVGAAVGIDRPLDRWAQYATYAVILGGGFAYETWRGVVVLDLKNTASSRRIVVNLSLIGVLPLVAVVGAERLNRGNGNTVAMVALVGAWIGILAFLLTSLVRSFERYAVELTSLLFGVVLSVVWAISMRGEWLFGWDIQKEYAVAEATSNAGRWLRDGSGDAYNSMLSITAMPAQLHSLTGVSIEWLFRAAYPLIVALVPVVMFASLRRSVAIRHAGPVIVALVAAGRAFPQQLPAIARQEIAMFLFAVAVVIMVGFDLGLRARKTLFAVLVAAIGFTHYTTSYATLVMCVLAWLYVVASARQSNPLRVANVLTVPVIAAIAVVTLGWNLAVAPNGVFFDEPLQSVTSDGLKVLDGQKDATLVQRWLGGTGYRNGSVEEYAAEIERMRSTKLEWMIPDADLARTTVSDSAAAVISGPFAEQTTKWNAGYALLGQVYILLAGGAVLRMLLRRKWTEDGVSIELVGLLIGALGINALLRVSSWAAEFYNPERAALHNSIVIVFAVALLVEKLSAKLRSLNLAVAVSAAALSFGAWGLVPYVFSGAPRAAVSEVSEDVERFLISDNERRAVVWMDEHIDDGLVQADRYGQVALLGKAASARFSVLDIMHPSYIDERSWVYATRSNLREGRARGLENGVFAIFDAPIEALERERSIVYTTRDSRVYR